MVAYAPNTSGLFTCAERQLAVSTSRDFDLVFVAECMEELVRLLVEELERRSRSSEYDNQLKQTLLLLRQTLSHFTPALSRIQRRSNFDSFDDCKISLNEDCATKDCSQVGLILRKIDDDETAAIFKVGVWQSRTPYQILTFLHSPKHILLR